MSNMSYCRFGNTLIDLRDCLEHINDELDYPEAKARRSLVEICQDILIELDADVDSPTDEIYFNEPK